MLELRGSTAPSFLVMVVTMQEVDIRARQDHPNRTIRLENRKHVSVSARQILVPFIRSNTLRNDEKPVRVILVLDGFES